MAARKKKGGEEGGGGGGGEAGSGRWMLTYLDMVTLLFGVFILLASTSKVDPHKTDVVFRSVRAGFAGGVNPFRGPESGGETVFKNLQPDGLVVESDKVKQAAVGVLKGQLQKVHIAFVEEERGLVISLFHDVYFNSGSAELSPEAKDLLHRLSDILVLSDRDIRLEGHTDEIPVGREKLLQKQDGARGRYDNFNLASDRALAVLHFLQDEGVEPGRMASVSYGSHRPNDGSPTPSGKAFNRVVDIVILKKPEERKPE